MGRTNIIIHASAIAIAKECEWRVARINERVKVVYIIILLLTKGNTTLGNSKWTGWNLKS
jgi:hypothetical protein